MRVGGVGIHLARVCDWAVLCVQKHSSLTLEWLCRLLMFSQPMYLGLVFFTDIWCHKTGSSPVPWVPLSFRLPIQQVSRYENWTVQSNGGMILTGENWSIGRETLYNVGGRWMNKYGAMVEWYWQGKMTCREENLFQCHLFYHKSHVYRPWIKYMP